MGAFIRRHMIGIGNEGKNRDEGRSLAFRTFIITFVIFIMLGIVLLAGYATNVLFVFFLAVLLAVFLRGITCWLVKRFSFSEMWALTTTAVALGAIIVLATWLMAPSIGKQMSTLVTEIPKAAEQFEAKIREYEWGRQLLGKNGGIQQVVSQVPNIMNRAGLFVSSAMGLIINLIVVICVGLYLAADPRLYIEGFLQLFPKEKRKRGREVFAELGSTLQRWLVGRLILMVTNGVATAVGLALLGVPLAIPLGIISGLLNFIPNVGPIIAGVPALLLAWTKGPDIALYVLIFFTAYQMLDGYVFTPLIEKRTVSMAPALTIMAQVLLGVLAGGLGVLLAVPLVAVVMVLVKMLYVRDLLDASTSS